MAHHNIIFEPEKFYHIYNRGNNRQDIFLDSENYRFFLQRLDHYFTPAGIELVAYCLMPNHFHLLIFLNKEANVSNIMRAFSDSYVKSFNSWHGRTGHLFEKDFQAIQIETEGHLSHLCSYIHLNPVKAGLVATPEEWEFSDYSTWLSTDGGSTLRKITLRDDFFGSANGYKKFVPDLAKEQKLNKKFEQLLMD